MMGEVLDCIALDYVENMVHHQMRKLTYDVHGCPKLT